MDSLGFWRHPLRSQEFPGRTYVPWKLPTKIWTKSAQLWIWSAGKCSSHVRVASARFGVPVSRFMRALCGHYGAELHNFGPNSILQAAVFVAVCEGYLGIEAHWDLW